MTKQTIKTASTLKKVNSIIQKHEYFKNSYFWSGNNKSSKLNFTESFKFKFNKIVYEIKQSCTSSSKNVYYNMEILVNGNKKDIRVLKIIS